MPDSFVFIGENLALDFVNTEVVIRNRPQDLLLSSDNLRRWKILAQSYYPELGPLEFPDGSFEQVLLLRGALRRIFGAVIAGEIAPNADLQMLNDVLRMGHTQIEQVGLGHFWQHLAGDARGVVAVAAATLLTQYDLTRLHQCKNERCILMFYDTTKNGTRRWCTPDCQNRARSIENYQRRREG